MLPNALPLSKNNVSGYHAGDHVPYYEHHAHGRDDGTWDAMRLYGCVCDSSWPVGLGPGETQEPEYFGPTCAAQHCPSGDDPMTARDETNCTGVLAKGGHGVGEPGNPATSTARTAASATTRRGSASGRALRAQLPLQGCARRADRDEFLIVAFCGGFARASRLRKFE